MQERSRALYRHPGRKSSSPIMITLCPRKLPSVAPHSSTVTGIARTYGTIRPHIRRTPVVEVEGSDFGLDGIRAGSQTGVPAACRIIQGPGSVRQPAAARRPGCGRGRSIGRQSWRGCGLCRHEAEEAGQNLRSGSGVSDKVGTHQRMRRRPGGHRSNATPMRWPRARSGRHNPARSSYTPTTRWKPCWARARSAWSLKSRLPKSTVLS